MHFLLKNFNLYNQDEGKCLDAKVFSAYNGTPVIKHNRKDQTSCSINNTIFLNNDKRPNYVGIATVRHEWGHSVQETMMGTPRYIFKIAIPSVTNNKVYNGDFYYSFPWERSAEYFGEAYSESYYPGSNKFSQLYFIMP